MIRQQERVSVALCTYNGARFLREQLDSIARQTRQPDELIILDDCSHDASVAVACEFAAHAPFPVRVTCQPGNVGYVRNFATAIARCSGDLIALADQDDVWHPEKLERCASAITTQGADAVFTNAELVDEDLRPLGRTLWQSIGFGAQRQRRFRDGAAVEVLLRRQVVTGATLMFRAAARDLLLPIPADGVHDRWIALLLAATGTVTFIPVPLMKYRQHPANQIGARRKRVAERFGDARARRRRGGILPLSPAWCMAVEERLQQHPERVRSRSTLAAVRSLREHITVRRNLPPARFRRLRPVAREVISGRYFRYSNGLISLAMDLLL